MSRWALLLAAPLAACAPVDEQALRSAVVGGSLDGADPAVVALTVRRARCGDEAPTLLCSGTLISPRVVLTAAHCLAVFGVEGQYEVVFGPSAVDPAAPRSVVVRAQVHPAYDAATHQHDLALLLLAAPVAVAPVPLPSSTLSAAHSGLAARAVGFGETKQAGEPAGLKRSGALAVATVGADAFTASPAPAMTCTGDSGGPVFVTLDTTEQLLGVTAKGDPGCATEAYNVRVDAAAAGFIQPFLEEASQAPVRTAEGALPLDGLCAQPCDSSAECPAALTCEKGEHGVGRCLSLTLREGDYLAACTGDGQCGAGGTCARVWPEGDAACRCFRPCEPAPTFGCSVTPGPAGLGWWWLLIAWTWIARSSPTNRLHLPGSPRGVAHDSSFDPAQAGVDRR